MKQRPILFKSKMVQAILEGRKTQTRRTLKIQPSWVESNNSIVSSGWQYVGKKGLPKLSSWLAKEDFATALLECEKCPYGQVGDQLWVRETFCMGQIEEDDNPFSYPKSLYVANYEGEDAYPIYKQMVVGESIEYEDVIWKPSIHMPRWASRILLEITDVRIERLQDISAQDARAEGILLPDHLMRKEPGRPANWDSMSAKEKDAALTSAAKAVLLGHDIENQNFIGGFTDLWQSINGTGSWADNPWVWRISFRVVEPQGGDL